MNKTTVKVSDSPVVTNLDVAKEREKDEAKFPYYVVKVQFQNGNVERVTLVRYDVEYRVTSISIDPRDILAVSDLLGETAEEVDTVIKEGRRVAHNDVQADRP
jgi:hypothetical protein